MGSCTSELVLASLTLLPVHQLAALPVEPSGAICASIECSGAKLKVPENAKVPEARRTPGPGRTRSLPHMPIFFAKTVVPSERRRAT